ncbi:cytochrome c oxidase assembly protein [Vibrio sinaloensis]|nr:cytochrome c oxidase assembly protein [Vibrio sinaloensis]
MLAATLAMFGFGFALVPLYDVMCEALGINGKKPIPSLRYSLKAWFLTHHVSFALSLWPIAIKVFHGSLNRKKTTMEVHPGEVIQTAYLAKKICQIKKLLVKQSPRFLPGRAQPTSIKIECFCFNQQPLVGQGQAKNATNLLYRTRHSSIDTYTHPFLHLIRHHAIV